MSIWGAIIGGTAGLAIGGPLGALIGGVAGHAAGKGVAAVVKANRDATRQITFTIGVIALSAKMARADGDVAPVEFARFEQLFHVPDSERAAVRRIFWQAQESTVGFEAYARQLAALFPQEKAVLEEVVDALFLIATADGSVQETELTYVREVARLFGLSDAVFAAIKARYTGEEESNPYMLLNITPTASRDEIRAAWKKLAREYHPDRLMAEGVPQEFIDLATRRLAAINAAYDSLMKTPEMAT